MSQKINIIQPAVFGGEITAFFTLKNNNFKQQHAKIAGFNLGLNTKERSEVINENRQRLSEIAEVDASNIVYARQIHSNNIAFATKGGTVENSDALITQTPGIALAIQVADCAAVLIYEPTSQTIAAVHAGWRGAAANILTKVIDEMKRRGAKVSSAQAYISPCIGKEHFEVGREVADQFPPAFVDSQSYNKAHLDLKSFLNSQLLKKGLSDENIEADAGCTVAEADKFYSYRREKEQSGRMMGLIKLST